MIESPEPVVSEIGDDIRPAAFRLSDDDGIGMLYGFFRQDRGVNATENDLGTFLSISVGQLIASVGRCSHAGDPDQVEIQRKIYLPDLFVHHGDRNILRRQRSDDVETQLRHPDGFKYLSSRLIGR